MMTLIAAAVLAVQPAPAPANPPSHHEQMEHSGTMGHMGSMSEKEMADCHKCCEEMMSKMHHGHAQHKGHAD